MKSEQEIRARIESLKMARKETHDMFNKEVGYDFEDYCGDLAEIGIEIATLVWVLG